MRHAAAAALVLLHAHAVAVASAALPAAFDWRNVNDTNWLNPVRNHHLPLNSSCASCWSVTAASVMGDRLNILAGAAGRHMPRLELSAQHLLNCVPGAKRCGYPGSASAAMRYVAEHGIVSEDCAPYENDKHPCDAIHACASMDATGSHTLVAVKDPPLYFVDKNIDVTSNDTAAMQTAILTGPIACGIHVSQSLLNYTGGVLTDTDGGHTSDDHSIMLVGWGVNADITYWLLQVCVYAATAVCCCTGACADLLVRRTTGANAGVTKASLSFSAV